MIYSHSVALANINKANFLISTGPQLHHNHQTLAILSSSPLKHIKHFLFRSINQFVEFSKVTIPETLTNLINSKPLSELILEHSDDQNQIYRAHFTEESSILKLLDLNHLPLVILPFSHQINEVDDQNHIQRLVTKYKLNRINQGSSNYDTKPEVIRI